MSAIDTNLPVSQLNPDGHAVQLGTKGPYDAYVSPSQTPGQTSAYQKRQFHTQNLPDAFVDRALRIRDSTENIAWLEQQKWQTQVVLPLRIVQDLVLHVEHFEAWPTFFSVTPEQAVAHMLVQSATVTEVKLLRWSLQARLEQGFMGTPLGQERYNAMLNQFATSMNETANAEVARALLDATDPQQTWLQRHGQMHIEDLHNYLKWDLFCFAALQKMPNNPLEIINQRVNGMMKAYGGRADTIILSEDLENYAQMVPRHKNEYWLGGERAVDNRNGKGSGSDRNPGGIFNLVEPVRWLQGNAIYIHRSMVVENQGDIDPWHRTRQFGEWNILENTVRDMDNYTSDRRTIFVYNQDRDTMSPLRVRDGIENCMMWEIDGTVKRLDASSGDPLYNRDARFYPFARETNTFDPIRYCGDLSAQHFDMNDVNGLAITMMNSAYRDAPGLKQTDAQAIASILNEAARRKRGGTNLGKVLWSNLEAGGEGWGVASPADVFETFALRLRAIMPQSIFLDPENAVYTFDGGKSAGRTLWETLVYSHAVPVYEAATIGTRRTSLLEVLLNTFIQMLKPGSTDAQTALRNLAESGAQPDTIIMQAVNYLRDNPTVVNMSSADIVTWANEQVRLYRAELNAAGDAEDSVANITATTRAPAGFVVPGTALTGTTLVYGIFDRATAAFRPPSATRRTPPGTRQQRDPLLEVEEEEEGDVVELESERAPQRERETVPEVSEGANSMMPTHIGAIHFFSQVIASAAGRGDFNASSRRTRTAFSSRDTRFGAVSERIGANYDQEQDPRSDGYASEQYFEARRREAGYMGTAARRLGLAGTTPSVIAASLGTLSSNMDALAQHGMSMIRKVMALVYYGMPFTKQTLLTLCDNDIVVPVTFLFVRPHITVESRIIVKCLSGGGAGYTYYAHANVAVGDNVLTGTHTINMHFYLRAHVHAPRNVFIIPDVFIMGYHGGMGVEPVTEPSQYAPTNPAPGAPCALYFMCSYKTTRESVPNPFDISGHFNSRYRVRGEPTVDQPAYDSAAFYVGYLGLNGITGNVDLPVMYEQHRNTLVYRGHQEEDDGQGGYTKIEPNTGHWGPKVYKGCKSVREGEMYELQDVAYGRGIVRHS